MFLDSRILRFIILLTLNHDRDGGGTPVAMHNIATGSFVNFNVIGFDEIFITGLYGSAIIFYGYM